MNSKFHGVTSLLIEGGSQVLGAAFTAKIIDKICFFYAPKIVGGNGIPITSGVATDRIADAVQVTDIQIHRFDTDFMVEAYINGTTG